MNSERINLRRRKQEGTPKCQINLRNRKASWKTQKENIADKIVHGTVLSGEKHHQAKLTEREVREIRRLRGKVTRKDLALQYGVKRSTIDNVLDGSTWRSVA